MSDPLGYEYRLTVDRDGLGRFDRLRDAELRAAMLAAEGVRARIEFRSVDLDGTDWAPLAWGNTLAGRLGYPPFPGYVDRSPGHVEAGECGG